MNTTTSFSIAMESQLNFLAQQIENDTKAVSQVNIELGYLEVLQAIYTITQPIFNRLVTLAEEAGLGKVEPFEAWPKGLCENFVFGVIESKKIQNVVLARNKKYKFLQNGGGKTGANETSLQAALRESQEEFGFTGKLEQVKKITIESESRISTFHFVKGVNIILITPQQAHQLKLADDMASNEIANLPVKEFLDLTDKEIKPIDHGFDRQWIAKYIRAFNSLEMKNVEKLQFNQRMITKEDQIIASKVFEWMKKIHVNKNEINNLQDLIQQFSINLTVNSKAQGLWKSAENREVVKKSSQKVVDAIVKKLLPDWKYIGKNGEETACQVKVQEAVGVLVNGDPLPAFLTIPQMVSLQCGLGYGQKFEITSFSQWGEFRNITTLPGKRLSKY